MDSDEPFNITDFPAEILEKFAPDHRPSTVSSLRLVNRRFRGVFSADRFYRGYVRYTNPDVAGDREEGEERRGRWWRALEEEKRLLAAWRAGRVARVETVQLPSSLALIEDPSNQRWQEAKGERGEHWLMRRSSSGRKIVLFDLASDPPAVGVIDVFGLTSKSLEFIVTLRPGRVLIRFLTDHFSRNDELQVFKIINGTSEISLQHIFNIENGQGRYCYSGSLLIQFLSSYAVLRIWDLSRSARLDDLELPRIVTRDIFDFNRPWVYITSYSVEYPMHIVTIKFEGCVRSIFLVVNLESRSLVTWFGTIAVMPLNIDLRGNMMLIHSMRFFVNLYDLRTLQPNLNETAPLFGYNYDAKTERCLYEPPNLVIITHEKYFVDVSDIVFVNMVGTNEQQIKSTNVGYKHYRVKQLLVAGPFMAVNRSLAALAVNMSGERLFDFTDLVKRQGVSFGNDKLEFVSTTLSKCVLRNYTGDRLFICYF